MKFKIIIDGEDRKYIALCIHEYEGVGPIPCMVSDVSKAFTFSSLEELKPIIQCINRYGPYFLLPV